MFVPAFWMPSPNFGDALTPWLIRRISGKPVAFVEPNAGFKHLVICGSVLNHASNNAIVWGAGLASFSDDVNPKADIRAVRGPMTWKKAIACNNPAPHVLGDPAMLLPELYDSPRPQHWNVGFVPHFKDQAHVLYLAGQILVNAGVLPINVLDSVEGVVDRIRSCKMIVSSSLHGLIVAHAYGIPAVWANFGADIGGDGFKFWDYFALVGLSGISPIALHDLTDIPAVLTLCAGRITLPATKFDTSGLWASCPMERISAT